jgi:hypothetical protein
MEIATPTATATLIVLTKFDKQALPAQVPTRSLTTKLKLNLKKDSRGKWLIERVEVLAINNQSVRWGDFSYRHY